MECTTSGVYIITGGAGAIAGAIAEVFTAAGARVVLADLPESAVARRAVELGAQAVEADLGTLGGAERMVAEAAGLFGQVDGLIHTVGGFAMAPAHRADMVHFDLMLDSNLRTLFCAVRAVLPELLARRSGFLAGISSSVVVEGGGAGMAVYAAAKGAVASFLHAVEAEVGGQGVGVAVVYPYGPVDTPRNRAEMPGVDPSAWVDAQEIGHALLFAATRSPRGRLVRLEIRPRTRG